MDSISDGGENKSSMGGNQSCNQAIKNESMFIKVYQAPHLAFDCVNGECLTINIRLKTAAVMAKGRKREKPWMAFHRAKQTNNKRLIADSLAWLDRHSRVEPSLFTQFARLLLPSSLSA
jgi:hypothetical protein